MLKYKNTPVEKLKVGDMLDLAEDKIVRHPVNAETATPAVIDRLEHDFAEVLSIERNSMRAVILTQWGDFTFPLDHHVKVFIEA